LESLLRIFDKFVTDGKAFSLTKMIGGIKAVNPNTSSTLPLQEP
jgi:hypothetical protein